MPTLGTSDDVVFVVSLVVVVGLFVLGIAERKRHRTRLRRVPVRVAVNGSRGKSTVTRLATGALAAGGYRTLGKTTGAEPRLLLGWADTEEPIHRRPEGPNIGEQINVMRRAADEGADAVVGEVMAINPEYQRDFVHELMDADLVVVTNVLGDHLEEMGPTTTDIADVFGEAFPRDGTVVLAPGPHLRRLRAAAQARGSRVELADPDAVDPSVLRRFDHLVFAEHVALVLALARAVDISEEAALEGMYRAPVDPFATRLVPVGNPDGPALFVNAFGANDPTSTLTIWAHVRDLGYSDEDLVTVMNCRADRVGRTRQFAEEVLPHLPMGTLVVAGEATQPVLRAVERGDVTAGEVVDRTARPAEDVVAAVEPLQPGRVVLTIGNLHGGGVEVVEEMERRAVTAGATGAIS